MGGPMTAHRPACAVIGGGVAGLAAARQLHRAGATVVVFEADARLGGKLVTAHTDGFVIEGGPDTLVATKPRGIGLCEELGLSDRLCGAAPSARPAHVLRGNRLHPLPDGLTGMVPTRLRPMATTRLLSPVAKIRMGCEILVPARRDEGDESLGAFVRRRLGQGAYERLVEPLVGGIFNGDPDRLSLAATLPQLRQAELTHGSLIRSALRAKRAAPAAGRGHRSPMVAFSGGMAELVEALHAELQGCDVRIGTPVRSVAAGPAGGFVVIPGNGPALAVDGVVVATPAPAAAAMLASLDAAAAEALGAVPYASVASINLGYRAAELPGPLPGSGWVTPSVEARPVQGCTFSSNKYPNRAPEGHVLVRGVVGRNAQDAVAGAGDEELVALVRAELRAVLGVTATPVITRVDRWVGGLPQYTLGHPERVARVHAALARHPGLAVAGAAYQGAGIPDCIASGEGAADAVLRAIGATGSVPLAG
jgi:protoporphyrinogen/coproporphyrinogen III oxidase